MDETRIQFDETSNLTIAEKGAQSISIKKSNSGDKQAITVILAGLSNGIKLPPVIIFPGSGK